MRILWELRPPILTGKRRQELPVYESFWHGRGLSAQTNGGNPSSERQSAFVHRNGCQSHAGECVPVLISLTRHSKMRQRSFPMYIPPLRWRTGMFCRNSAQSMSSPWGQREWTTMCATRLCQHGCRTCSKASVTFAGLRGSHRPTRAPRPAKIK